MVRMDETLNRTATLSRFLQLVSLARLGSGLALVCFCFVVVCTSCQWGKAQEQQGSADLAEEQRILAEQYKLLEEKLFTLYEYEKLPNPARSKLLERAYTISQRNRTTEQLQQIVQLLATERLKDAEKNQSAALEDLNALLVLLESENRGKRVRDELAKNQEYLDEIKRLQRIQKGIRGQAENGLESSRLETSQRKLTDRTRQLDTQIAGDEGGDSEQANSGEPGPGSDPKGAKTETETETESEQANPVRKRIQAAEDRMQKAREGLENANPGQSIEEMQAAEDELAEAIKELEEILRQLREEEVERVLALLEGRFRKMLERQIRVLDTTRRLDQVDKDDRLAEFEIEAGRLSLEEKAIAGEASRALLLLREDGSSVAFPSTVEQMQLDMEQVAARLSEAKVESITQGIIEDIVESLDGMINALVQTQQDMDSSEYQADSGQAGEPGDQPLVDSLSEIKMIRGLQQQILRRHERYAKLLDDPDDLLGETDDPDIRAALDRLSERQKQLSEITRDIAIGKNK